MPGQTDRQYRPPLLMLIADQADGARIKRILVNFGISVRHVLDEKEAVAALGGTVPDLLLAGWDDQGFDGRAILARLKIKHLGFQGIPAILMTGHKVDEFTRYNLSRLDVKWVVSQAAASLVLPKLIAWFLKPGAAPAGWANLESAAVAAAPCLG